VLKEIIFSKQKNKKPTHAGGVVFREKNGYKEFLLVSARNLPFIWVLPKGNIKRSETEAEAAIREVKEESGMKVTIIGKLENEERIKRNFKKQIVAFYIMKFEAVHLKNEENRKVRWLTIDNAVKKLFYGYQKKIMRKLKP
jgi:8-oxo-dGTP pyrophosphatase MutT (NUDIX family)